MNWNQDNTITKEMGQETYTTQGLKYLFAGFETQGYSAMSLGLIIDLVRRYGEKAGNSQANDTAKKMPFETWKSEFVPVVYQDSGAECYDHESCECEFLYTFSMEELIENEEHASAISENRVWTWLNDGAIVSGAIDGGELLVTAKPYTERMEIR